MSFPRYGEYRDSGIQSLGEVPAHWSLTRLRYVAEMNPPKAEVAHVNPSTVATFLPMEAIGEDGSLKLDLTRPISDLAGGYSYFRDGDVAIAKITPCFENGKGAFMHGLANQIGFGTTELIVARPRPEYITGPYLHLVFTSAAFRQLGEARMYGAGGQKRVPEDFVKDFVIAVPPLHEQMLIVEVLGSEVAKINALIIEQRRLIELLKEKRHAVISHAVTKGLNPDVPTKATGVEWLPEIPQHWHLKPLKRLALSRGGVQMGPFGGMLLGLSEDDTGFKVFGQENTISGDFARGRRWISEERFTALTNYHLAVGDLVLTRKGSLGNARLVEALPQPGIIDSDTIRVRVRREAISSGYLGLLLHDAWYVAHQIELTKRGAILPGLNSETISNLTIVVPPRDEQDELLCAIRDRVAVIDEYVAEAERAISLLQERRASLVSAAVTGKIDIRGLVDADAVAA